jgi:hypothetical protein
MALDDCADREQVETGCPICKRSLSVMKSALLEGCFVRGYRCLVQKGTEATDETPSLVGTQNLHSAGRAFCQWTHEVGQATGSVCPPS